MTDRPDVTSPSIAVSRAARLTIATTTSARSPRDRRKDRPRAAVVDQQESAWQIRQLIRQED